MSIYLLAVQLAITLIFQDEAPYLKEWIEYYRMMGVEHFYFYNNLSQDNYLEVLEPYLQSGVIELHDWPKTEDPMQWPRIQGSAYEDAIDRACKDQVKWLAVVDADEFLVPRKKETLIEFLADYENETVGFVTVFWVCFGTSHVAKIPEDRLMIETLLLNGGYRVTNLKSVVRPERVDLRRGANPHTQALHQPFVWVKLPFEEIQCNHYCTRDEYYFNQFKIARKIRMGMSVERLMQLNDTFNQSTQASEPILRFVPLLRERLFGDGSFEVATDLP